MVLAAAVAVPGVAAGQAVSGHAGEERRQIKALSPQEIHSYRIGEGMGLAKAAELNNYPGPKHVLELAKELGLSAEQARHTEEIRSRMLAEAVRIGNLIIQGETNLDRLFAEGTITEDSLTQATKKIAFLQAELRAVHLYAHVEMRQVLTPSQIERYGVLRGYASGQEHRGHH